MKVRIPVMPDLKVEWVENNQPQPKSLHDRIMDGEDIIGDRVIEISESK